MVFKEFLCDDKFDTPRLSLLLEASRKQKSCDGDLRTMTRKLRKTCLIQVNKKYFFQFTN